MQLSITTTLTLALMAGAFVLALPAMRTGYVLCGLVMARSLIDLGASAGGSLLPSSTLSAAIGAAAVLASFVPSQNRLTKRLRRTISLVYFGIILGTLTAIDSFGLDLDSLKEPLRLASIVAIFVLAYRYASGTPILERKFPIAFAVLPALILVVGYVAKVPMMLSDQVRAAGTFSHPNAAAAFFCVSGVFCFSAWWPKRTSLPAWGVALSATAIVLTGSLGGIAALIAGILLVVTISSRLKPIQKAILLTTVIVVAVAGYSVVGGSGRFAEFESFDASAALQTGTSSDSLEWRLINWQLLIPYWQSKPWLGQGIGTTYKYIMPLGGPPHSLFVQLLVETGVIGCVIIAVTWFASASAITKKLRGGSWEATGLLALMSVLVVNGSESNLLGYTAAMYAFAFYGGILSYGIASRAALPPTPTNRLSVPRLPGARI